MPATATGIDGFVAGLGACGIAAETRHGLVLFTLEPVDGPYAGTPLVTGVETSELQRWPAVPPHWIHMPSQLTFPRTNSQPSPETDLTRHSRQIRDWGADPDPIRAWVSHHRGVLGEATR